jgi:hypothetical protein
MKVFETTHSDVIQVQPIQLPTQWKFAKSLKLVAIWVLAIIFSAPIASLGLASEHPTESKDTVKIDSSAVAALERMSVYLRTLKSFQVSADVTTDDVLDSGQAIQFSSKIDVIAERPNHMRAEISDDEGHRFLFFDGKHFTIFGENVNFYSTVPAPPTIAQLIDDIGDKYGIEFPLADLFKWGANDSAIKKIKLATDIGPSTVGGVTCEQYAFRQEGIDWQIWIQLGEFPLPRKVVIRTLTDPVQPQHSELFTWNLAPSFSENAFTFDPPAEAHRILMAEDKSAPAKKK